MDKAVEMVAERVAEIAREHVDVRTGRLRDAIHVEHEGPGRYRVVAGNEQAWYGMLVEHGTVHSPAHPFMGPAEEQTRPGIQAIGAAALRGL